MIDFKKEIAKFDPVMEVDDVENSINSDEIQDLMDILIRLEKQANRAGKE